MGNQLKRGEAISCFLFLMEFPAASGFLLRQGSYRVAAAVCVPCTHGALTLAVVVTTVGTLGSWFSQLQCEPGFPAYYKTAAVPISAASVVQWAWVLDNIIFSFLHLVLRDGVFQLLISFGICSPYNALVDNLLY